jgi:cyclophilin family peptidyl-prolyl cis-trans isomerase
VRRGLITIGVGFLWIAFAAGCPKSGGGEGASQTVASTVDDAVTEGALERNGAAPHDGADGSSHESQEDTTTTPSANEVIDSLAEQRQLIEQELVVLSGSPDPDQQRIEDLKRRLRDIDKRIASATGITEDLPPPRTPALRLRGQVYSGPKRPIEELRNNLTEIWEVQFDTTFGGFTMEVYPELAPIHASKFLELVEEGFYNNMHIQRIAPGRVVQWGDMHDYYDSVNLRPNQEPPLYPQYEERAKLVVNLPDEPGRFPGEQWTVSFAKHDADAASPQPVINLSDSTKLEDDDAPDPPFAYVVSGRDKIEMLVRSFEPAMARAQADLRAALEAQGAPEAVIEQQLREDLAWGQFLSKYWNPFRVALILEARITGRPVLD